jgi:hypothetical protein
VMGIFEIGPCKLFAPGLADFEPGSS